MRKHFLWLALSTGLGLSACATGPRPQVQPAPLDPSKACASWRWIGISRPGAQCPAAPGWTVRPLFPQLAPIQKEPECPDDGPPLDDVPDPKVIRELNRFCVYEIADSKKSLKETPFPPTESAELVRIDKDCAALSLSETYSSEVESWTTGSEELLVHAGKPKKPLVIDNQRSVRLAFLDTQPTGEDVPKYQGHSPHGYTLAKIAQELVCTPEPNEQEPYRHCAAQITTQLAMPILKFNAKHPQDNRIDLKWGGFLGMQSDLAAAIRKEVQSWLEQRTEKSQRHLVLNLSLAWDGRLFSGLSGEQIADMQAGTQAVYRALEYAAGFDVLVLAAAGNQKQEPCMNFGPLLPAAWEEEAPRERKCCGKPDDKSTPLIYAVGGVQEDGSPLANARPGGMPRRVAYGKTKVFEGSSVATAIVSSIAARVWDNNPGFDSHQVMKYLDEAGETLPLSANVTGVVLPRQADFWFPIRDGSRPPVRRLSLCSVLNQPCFGESLAARPLESAGGDGRKPKNAKESTKGSCQPWLLPQPEILPCPACIEDPPRAH